MTVSPLLRIAGIDPGKGGCLAVLENGAVQVYDTPLLKIGTKERINFTLMARDWDYALHDIDHVFIEQVGAMPGQGVTSMFTFGYAAGFAYGLVQAKALPHTFISPQSWKKLVGISGSDKDESRRRACQLFSLNTEIFARKKDNGRADATLIAYAGLLKLGEAK